MSSAPAPRVLFRFDLTVTEQGTVYNVANEMPGLSKYGLARILALTAANLFKDADQSIMTTEQQAQVQHAQDVVRDYPARTWFPQAGVALCVACEDLYADLIEGIGVAMPPGAPQPCTFHLDPSKAPMSFEEASKRRIDQDTDAEMVAQDSDVVPEKDN